jgi:small-conductance mechanosensitive channel
MRKAHGQHCADRGPRYIADPKPEAFYLRVGASTVEFDVEEAVAYCRERWPAPLLARVLRLTRPT